MAEHTLLKFSIIKRRFPTTGEHKLLDRSSSLDSLAAESLTKHDDHQISESEETGDLGCVMAEDGVLGARVDSCHMSVFLLYAQTPTDLWHVDGWDTGRVEWGLRTLSAAIGTS